MVITMTDNGVKLLSARLVHHADQHPEHADRLAELKSLLTFAADDMLIRFRCFTLIKSIRDDDERKQEAKAARQSRFTSFHGTLAHIEHLVSISGLQIK